jgi:hypothetical protein
MGRWRTIRIAPSAIGEFVLHWRQNALARQRRIVLPTHEVERRLRSGEQTSIQRQSLGPIRASATSSQPSLST